MAVSRFPSEPDAVAERRDGAAGGIDPELQPLCLREVRELLRYALDRGLDPEAKLLPQVFLALTAWARLRDRATPEADQPTRELLTHYAALARLTAESGVSGRSIVQSGEFDRKLRPLTLLGLALLVLGLAIQVYLAANAAAEPALQSAAHYVRTALEIIVPALWGALGACVWLVKTISDKASELVFDADRLRGLSARVLLGAVFGSLLVHAFGFEIADVTTAGVAFLAGLGTKAVYAAFEALVNGIHDRIVGPRGQA
jgi:hypothetical protein